MTLALPFKLNASWRRMLLSAICMLLVFEWTPLDVWLADGYFVAGKFVGDGNWWLEVFSHKWVKWSVILLALMVWARSWRGTSVRVGRTIAAVGLQLVSPCCWLLPPWAS